MNKLERRRIISTVADFVVVYFIWIVGAGAWSLTVFALSLWSYYDGLTRRDINA